MKMIFLCFLVGNGARELCILNLKRKYAFEEQYAINLRTSTFGGYSPDTSPFTHININLS